MQRLIYNLWFEVPDWRIFALAELEYIVVCKASKTTIHHYDSEDLAQELRINLWNNLNSFNPTK